MAKHATGLGRERHARRFRLRDTPEVSAETADRHLTDQAAQEVRLRHDLRVYELAVGLDRQPVEYRSAEQLERTRYVGQPKTMTG